MTFPSEARRSFVRTNAPPLPGLTCWNSRTLKTVPSTSMWFPFLNWLVLIMPGPVYGGNGERFRTADRARAGCGVGACRARRGGAVVAQPRLHGRGGRGRHLAGVRRRVGRPRRLGPRLVRRGV